MLETIIINLVSNSMNDEQKIINYATDKFLESGFYKTSMDQLATGMKISKKTIYKFFPSKLSLLERVMLTFQMKIKTDLDEITNSDKYLVEKLHEVSAYFAKFSLKMNKKFLNDIYNHQPELWKKIDKFRSTVIESVWGKLISEGKEEGIIIDKSSKIIEGIILSSLTGIINPKFLMLNNLSVNEAFKETFSIIINGILTEKGKKEFEEQQWKI